MTTIMTTSPLARRRRAVDALGLGPLWTLRERRDEARPVSEDERARAIASMDREALAAAVASCTACPLSASRTRTVFGDGPATAEWFLVGAAPDAADEQAGTPFAGAPGKLLDAMLAAIGVARGGDAFVTNLVKCRPPGDRAPTPDEVARCRPFLDRQAELIAARVVMALGSGVGDIMIGDPSGTTTLASRTMPLAIVSEPSALIRTPERKAAAWVELCAARDVSVG